MVHLLHPWLRLYVTSVLLSACWYLSVPSLIFRLQVDNWVYDEANSTFIEDPEMANRLMTANPNSFRKLVATFLEANGRGEQHKHAC